MRRLICSLLLSFVAVWGLQAQIQISNSGAWNTVFRINGNAKYLLMPIQESAPELWMRVFEDNRMVDKICVRLAQNRVDYYVPYVLEGHNSANMLFDVRQHTDRIIERTGHVWMHELKLSDTFDTTNRESYRPQYHHTPAYGWMNDPNGMFYLDGVWHLYYQYNPYCSMWQNMTWAHSTSRDLIHWQAEPWAIMPDDLGTIFSGSCVVDHNNTAGFGSGAIIALYTSAGEYQSQCMAYSTDGGRTFQKYPGNPILTADIVDFRDPNMFWNEDTHMWNLVLACGQEVRFYTSPDLAHWTYQSSFGEGFGSHDGVWECPDLMKISTPDQSESKWVLLLNINPGGPFGGSATQYFVGNWDGTKFTCEHHDTRWLDYGKDHYATVSFSNAPDNRKTVVAWMSNWQYANNVPTQQYRSANSLPRDLHLFKDDAGAYRVGVHVSPEVVALRGKAQSTLTPSCMVELDIKRSNKPAVITLSNNKGEKVVMTYDFAANTFTMDRTQSGLIGFSQDFAAQTTTPLYASVKNYHLTLYIDNSSIEAFDGEGRWAMTNLVFPTVPYDSIKVVGAKAKIFGIKKENL